MGVSLGTGWLCSGGGGAGRAAPCLEVAVLFGLWVLSSGLSLLPYTLLAHPHLPNTVCPLYVTPPLLSLYPGALRSKVVEFFHLWTRVRGCPGTLPRSASQGIEELNYMTKKMQQQQYYLNHLQGRSPHCTW